MSDRLLETEKVLNGLVRALRDIAPLIQTGLELEDHILAAPLSVPSSSLQKKLNEILSHASIECESNTTTMPPVVAPRWTS